MILVSKSDHILQLFPLLQIIKHKIIIALINTMFLFFFSENIKKNRCFKKIKSFNVCSLLDDIPPSSHIRCYIHLS